MKKAVFLFFIIVTALSLFAQKKGFHHGAYVTAQGDTVRGFIYLPGNSQSLKFKREQDDTEIADVQVDSLKSLMVNNGVYLLWYGKRSVTWLDPFEQEIRNADSFRTEMIMLKPVYEGNRYSLYQYRDETDRFFIGYAGVVEELKMTFAKLSEKEYRDRSLLFNRPRYSVFATYRSQIISILGGRVSEYEKYMIEHTEYNELHLKRLLKEMEGW
ncbi:hypothetical protein [Pollutibacter soli]|uniref:hypothetical protein n=1 Tax=Pollutibacter soli TaxID=3034157 RepID=UPI003013245F